MPQAHSPEHSVKPDDAILYLLISHARESRGDGYKLPMYRLHDIFYCVEDEIESELGIPLKFHESSDRVFSKQIKEALENLVPYTIPVQNPSFTLEITPEVADVALVSLEEALTDEQTAALRRVFDDEGFQGALESHTRSM